MRPRVVGGLPRRLYNRRFVLADDTGQTFERKDYAIIGTRSLPDDEGPNARVHPLLPDAGSARLSPNRHVMGLFHA
jgi:hypothetical protein